MSSFLREIGLKKGSQAETFPISYRGIENFILLDFDNTLLFVQRWQMFVGFYPAC